MRRAPVAASRSRLAARLPCRSTASSASRGASSGVEFVARVSARPSGPTVRPTATDIPAARARCDAPAAQRVVTATPAARRRSRPVRERAGPARPAWSPPAEFEPPGGRAAVQIRDGDHLAAPAPHHLSLGQRARRRSHRPSPRRPDAAGRAPRSGVSSLEDDHRIDRTQRAQHRTRDRPPVCSGRLGPLRRRTESSEFTHTTRQSPSRAGRRQHRDVTGVQQVEAAAGRHHRAPARPGPRPPGLSGLRHRCRRLAASVAAAPPRARKSVAASTPRATASLGSAARAAPPRPCREAVPRAARVAGGLERRREHRAADRCRRRAARRGRRA